MGGRKKLTTDEFVLRAKLLHNENYLYNKTNYINKRTKVIITCKKHGDFEQLPQNHINGSGCPKCGTQKNIVSQKLTKNEFINKANSVHNNIYDYSLVDYVNNVTKIKIICKKHGVFKQTPTIHFKGSGCPKCAGKNVSNLEFIQKAIAVHGNKYNYSQTKYVSARNKIKIGCEKHGQFFQRAFDHLAGHGCPKCKESFGERKIREYLEINKIMFEKEKKFDKCRNKNHLLFDFYLPEKNILIEYDGEQHFKPINFFGGKHTHKKVLINDNIKNEFAKQNNIKLLRIPFTELEKIDAVMDGIL
jgi:very-short-patch-repair endonuclease